MPLEGVSCFFISWWRIGRILALKSENKNTGRPKQYDRDDLLVQYLASIVN